MRRPRIAPAGQEGMTLVEMLIVLAIVGIAASAVTLGIGSISREPTVESEARRLAAMIQGASDDAMLGDRIVAFTVDGSGYAFSTWSGRGWVAGERHPVPAGMTVTLDVRPPVVLGSDGSGQPLTARLSTTGQDWLVRYDGLTATALPVPGA